MWKSKSVFNTANRHQKFLPMERYKRSLWSIFLAFELKLDPWILIGQGAGLKKHQFQAICPHLPLHYFWFQAGSAVPCTSESIWGSFALFSDVIESFANCRDISDKKWPPKSIENLANVPTEALDSIGYYIGTSGSCETRACSLGESALGM